MGWMHDGEVEHEGYVVAVEREESGHWAEVGYFHERTEPKRARSNVRTVQVACDCGWRSPRFVAPFGTRYDPYVVTFARQDAEDRAHGLWREHIDACLELGRGHRPGRGPRDERLGPLLPELKRR